MIRTLVIQVNDAQAEALRNLLVRGDGRHGDPLSAWESLGAVVAKEYGPILLAQLADQRLTSVGESEAANG